MSEFGPHSPLSAMGRRLRHWIRNKRTSFRAIFDALTSPQRNIRTHVDSAIAVPIVIALAVIALPILGTLPGNFWTASYWGGSAENRMEIIRNFALVVGGSLGLLLAWWRLRISDRQARTAEEDHIYERYERGVDLLTNDQQMIQIAGIHTIQRSAERRPDLFAQDACRLLCAFYRKIAPPSEYLTNPATRQVREACIEAITELYPLVSFQKPNNIRKIFDLSMANLSDIRMIGIEIGDFDFNSSLMTNLQFKDCVIDNVDTELRMDFSGAAFIDCTFQTILYGWNLADTKFVGCTFNETSFDTCNFTDATFASCRINRGSGVPTLFDECNISRMIISEIDLLLYLPTRAMTIETNFAEDDFANCRISDATDLPIGGPQNKPRLEFLAHPSEQQIDVHVQTVP